MRQSSRPKTGRPPRNLLHDHPLLRKGQAHGKTRKAERRAQKVGLRRDDRGWHSAIVA